LASSNLILADPMKMAKDFSLAISIYDFSFVLLIFLFFYSSFIFTCYIYFFSFFIFI